MLFFKYSYSTEIIKYVYKYKWTIFTDVYASIWLSLDWFTANKLNKNYKIKFFEACDFKISTTQTTAICSIAKIH